MMNWMRENARYAFDFGVIAPSLLLIMIIIRALYGDYSVDTATIGLLAVTVTLQNFKELLITSDEQ